MSEHLPPDHPLHPDNRTQIVPKSEQLSSVEKQEQNEYVERLVSEIIEQNGWVQHKDQLKAVFKGVDRGAVQAKVPEKYGVSADAAAHYDPSSQKIVIFDAFFKMSPNLQAHILNHEVGHALEALIDQTEYQKITAGHQRKWEGKYVREVKNDELHEQERLVDDLADFLRSGNPVQMFLYRLKRISWRELGDILPDEWAKISWRQQPMEDLEKQLEEDIKKPDSLLRQSELYQEIEHLYKFFDKTVRQGLKEKSPDEVKKLFGERWQPGQEGPYDPFDELDFSGYDLEESGQLPTGQREMSFFQLLTHNIALAQQQDVRSLFKK